MSHSGPVLEIADIECKTGLEDEFARAFSTVLPVLADVKGCRAASLHRSVENPSRFRLFVQWESVEAHMVDFRNSAAFQEWRRVVGPFFAAPPTVEHVYEV
jgi:quinol monooxygenase YgiN